MYAHSAEDKTRCRSAGRPCTPRSRETVGKRAAQATDTLAFRVPRGPILPHRFLPPYRLDSNLHGLRRQTGPKVDHSLSLDRYGALRATIGLQLFDSALLLSQLGLQSLDEFRLRRTPWRTARPAGNLLSKLGDFSSQTVKLTLGRTARPRASGEVVLGRASGPTRPPPGPCERVSPSPRTPPPSS